jgi:hypothetical protein
MKARKLLQLAMVIMISFSIAGCTKEPTSLRIVHLGKPVRPGDIETLTVLGVDEMRGTRPVISDWSLEGVNGLLLNSTGHAAYVFALSPGTARVTARKGDLVATSDFDVYEPVLAKLILLEHSSFTGIEMQVGEKSSLYVNGYDQFGRDLKIDPVWSVTDKLAVFSEREDYEWHSNIYIEAIKGGTGTITVEQDGISTSIMLVVHPYEQIITRYEVIPASATVYVGDVVDFYAQAWDQIGREIWLDSSYVLEGDIGRIQDYGRPCQFTAEKVGTGRLVASYDSFTAYAEISVIEKPIE